jgi:hypothetical protein
MKKILISIAVISVVFTVNTAQTTQDNEVDWLSSAPPKMDLRVGYIEIQSACNPSDGFKKSGPQTLSGPGAGPGPSNNTMDGFTAPTWSTGFNTEQYLFTSITTIDHYVILNNTAGPWPTPVSLAFVWQICGNGAMFPPIPATLGTNAPWDGVTLALTLPFSDNCWTVNLGISGIATGTWDWIWLARYDGVTPIPVIPYPFPGNDTCGGNYYLNAIYSVYELTTGIGGGSPNAAGADRPWCFQVIH